ncbi:hypothetical protein DICPUDRAFT_76739 [Dictyostelium purpureum]|uniref:Uncharacterized protein n=1 Tax=Dictyostelium purpureum TaxID=5786 RepID=F0ZEH4_DICPU|nr:uncharacterized protein DICPUDRAFT_76739 [Dictyostelium purpureum]EGC37627.1 hypothetical protein DICPUDRAFT_76739 [Dictyostelium purpureum]|eukprot:XP_003285815.1 hypothetical protein DICPUDRAFT_76739 [Dictyostelium purpureum]
MKIYIHYESEPEETIIVQPLILGLETVEQLKSYFLNEYKKRHPNSDIGDSVDLKDKKGKNVFDSNLIAKHFSNLDDGFIVKSKGSKPSTTSTASASNTSVSTSSSPSPSSSSPKTSSATTTSTSIINNNNSVKKTTTTTTNNNKNNNTTQSPTIQSKYTELPDGMCDQKYNGVIKPLLEQGERFYENQLYKNAISYYENILTMLPSEYISLVRCSNIYYEAKKWKVAKGFIESGIMHYPNDIQFHHLRAKLMLETGDYLEAIKSLESILELLNPSDEKYDEFQAIYGKALYETKNPRLQDEACDLLTSLVHKNEKNIQALIGFTHVLIDKGQLKDASQAVLQLLGTIPEMDKKKQLTKYLPLSGETIVLNDPYQKERKWTQEKISDLIKILGVDTILSGFNPGSVTPQLMAFLSNYVKEFGAIKESMELIRRSSMKEPSYVPYRLSLIHTLEITQQYGQAIELAMDFLRKNRNLGLTQFPDVNNETFLAILEKHIKPGYKHIYEYQSFKKDAPEGGPQKVSKDILVIPPGQPAPAPYTQDELDLMGLWFATSKLCYAAGILEPLPEIISLVEKIRIGRDIHLSSSRNENAYFCCVSALMPYKTLPLPKHRPIYIAGDSHCFSTAWTPVTIQGEQRLFHPLLVTGLKMWHLRPSTKFYPKVNFYNVVPTAPPGSEIVFEFGEIDCREGIVVSVDRCRYKDLEEGMNITIDFYIDALKDLIKKYNYKIFIHPVVPVLEHTRHIVKVFNKIFEKRIRACKEFVWLDFFPTLLKPQNENAFNPIYALDGTHMNPTYVSLIEASINKHYNEIAK